MAAQVPSGLALRLKIRDRLSYKDTISSYSLLLLCTVSHRHGKPRVHTRRASEGGHSQKGLFSVSTKAAAAAVSWMFSFRSKHHQVCRCLLLSFHVTVAHSSLAPQWRKEGKKKPCMATDMHTDGSHRHGNPNGTLHENSFLGLKQRQIGIFGF